MKKWMVLALAAGVAAGVQAKDKETPDQIFAAMDADKDGKVTVAEYAAYEKEQSKETGKQYDKQRCEKKFKKLDGNKDGFLTKNELQEVERAKSSGGGSDDGGGGGD